MKESGNPNGLPSRQREILEFIEDTVAQQGFPPTVREIAAAVGLCSPASVHSHLAALERKGYIKRGLAKRRALEVVRSVRKVPDGQQRAGRIPLVGRVAAGAPLLALESPDEFLEVPDFLGVGEGCFALRVSGNSMIKAGIIDGDVVIVKRQATAEDGDIVVALLEEEATLKRFFRESQCVRLQPENDSMEPIFTKEPRILGRVTGVLRRL